MSRSWMAVCVTSLLLLANTPEAQLTREVSRVGWRYGRRLRSYSAVGPQSLHQEPRFAIAAILGVAEHVERVQEAREKLGGRAVTEKRDDSLCSPFGGHRSPSMCSHVRVPWTVWPSGVSVAGGRSRRRLLEN